MKFNFPLLLTLASLAQATKKSQSKRVKKVSVQEFDDDFAFLDEQIKMNDIHSHYDINTLNATLYLPTLVAAHAYSSGMQRGLQLEAQCWNETLFNLHVNASIAGDSSSAAAQEYQSKMSTHQSILRATIMSSTWQLFTTGLENLIRNEQPHPLFFELISNVFVKLDITLMVEYINNQAVDTATSKKKFIDSIAKKLQGIRTEDRIMESSIGLFALLKLMMVVVEVDIISPYLFDTVELIVKRSIRDFDLEVETTGYSSMSAIISEIVALLKFYNILFPLIQHNKPLLNILKGMRYPKPSLHLFKNRDMIDAIELTSQLFLSSLQNRVMFEPLVRYETSVFSKSALMDDFHDMEPNLLWNATKFVLSDYKTGRAAVLGTSTDVLFNSNSKAFSTQNSTNAQLKLASPSSDHLNAKLANTLETLLRGTDQLMSKLEWSVCEQLIVAMDGKVGYIGGSLVMISFGSGQSVRFDRSQNGITLGLIKAKLLRVIFKTLGVE